MSQYKHRKAKDQFRTTEKLANKSWDDFYLEPGNYQTMKEYHRNLVKFYSRIPKSRERDYLELEAEMIQSWLVKHQDLKEAA